MCIFAFNKNIMIMFRNFILLLFPALFSAQCVIDADTYGIDQSKHLIVINKNIDELNASFPGTKTYLSIEGDIYTFTAPVENLQKGTAYTVSKSNINYTAFFSDLPIIRMTTTGPIKDTPKVLGNFEILVPGETKISSMIGVEYRGASSQSYPKKSMEVEFWLDENGNETQDISVLNLFEDDAVNLQAMYIEKLRINSVTANDLWQEVHPDVYYKDKEPDARSGILMKYSDLFVNGQYKGIYAVGEKVKRKFLKLKKFDNGIKGELYKGDQWGGATLFNALNPYNNNSDYWDGYEYKHPKELIDWSNLYNFVDYVINSNTETFNSTYSQKIDVDNMVDYFIFMNVTRALDNMGKNTYVAKYKKNEPYFIVPWDLDATFGTYWEGSNQNIYNDLLFNGLFSRLWEDPDFRIKISDRWAELRSSIITKEHINGMLTDNYLKLKDNGIYTREKIAWSSYNFPTAQLNYHTTWVKNRIDYLDTVFPFLGVEDSKIPDSSISLFPNPAKGYFSVNLSSPLKNAEIKIIDLSGKELQKTNIENLDKKTQIPVGGLDAGVYFIILKTKDSVRTSRLIIKK